MQRIRLNYSSRIELSRDRETLRMNERNGIAVKFQAKIIVVN